MRYLLNIILVAIVCGCSYVPQEGQVLPCGTTEIGLKLPDMIPFIGGESSYFRRNVCDPAEKEMQENPANIVSDPAETVSA